MLCRQTNTDSVLYKTCCNLVWVVKLCVMFDRKHCDKVYKVSLSLSLSLSLSHTHTHTHIAASWLSHRFLILFCNLKHDFSQAHSLSAASRLSYCPYTVSSFTALSLSLSPSPLPLSLSLKVKLDSFYCFIFKFPERHTMISLSLSLSLSLERERGVWGWRQCLWVFEY